MISSFVESIRYVGHLVPLAFLRIYVGYMSLDVARGNFSNGFLTEPRLAAMISEWVPGSAAPIWYKSFLEGIVVSQWEIFSYVFTYLYFVVGLGLIIGFLVRPLGLVGALLALNFMYLNPPDLNLAYNLSFAVMLTLSWMGAGRCLGMDYFFFKRHRGIWW